MSTTQITVPRQQIHNGDAFPLVIERTSANSNSAEESFEWLAASRGDLLAKAETHGAVLFRGFPLQNAEDFDGFVSAFNLENFAYQKSLSNAVRINFTPRVFSANEAPCDVNIHLHHEMAQTPMYPKMLFFFCEKPAEQGGVTPLCRSDVLLSQIEKRYPGFSKDCAEKGLKYTNVMPSENDPASGMGRSWQSTFGSDSKEGAEQRMGELKYSWEWLDDGCLRATTPRLPAILKLDSGRRVFFNQLIAAFQGWKDSRNDPSKSIRFGDGTALDADMVRKVAEMADKLTFDLEWKAGDVALVDNRLAMHARRPFQGTRKVLASLVESVHNRFEPSIA